MADHVVRFLDLKTDTVRECSVAAGSDAQARQVVEDGGGLVLDVRVAPTIKVSASRPTTPSIRTADVSLLCREIRALVGAGLSLVEALDALATAVGAQTESLPASLLARLREGKSMSVAMRDVGGFPSLLIASVQSSERTSNLSEALDAYLRYDELVGALRRRVISAALYPLIVVTLGIAVAVFLLLVVIPRFSALYGEMAGTAGAATRSLIGVSVALHDHPMLVPSCVALIALVVAAMLYRGRWRRVLQWVMLEVPWLRAQLSHFEKARVFEALAMLVKGGYSLHEAIGLCIGVSDGTEGAQRLLQVQASISRGASVSSAFAAAGMTDPVTERLLRAGDRGGDFHRVLRAIGDRHARSFETFVERATRVVEPLLLLIVALVVGGMVLLLYMPIFDIAASVR